jgi:hypothetical protein
MEAELMVREIFGDVIQECEIIPLKPRVQKKISKNVTYNHEEYSRNPTPISELELDLCVALWRGVVMQAIYDISAAPNDYDKKVTKAKAYNWFSSEDFVLVCGLAEMNPSRILDLVRLIRCGRVQVLDSKTFKIKRR